MQIDLSPITLLNLPDVTEDAHKSFSKRFFIEACPGTEKEERPLYIVTDKKGATYLATRDFEQAKEHAKKLEKLYDTRSK